MSHTHSAPFLYLVETERLDNRILLRELIVKSRYFDKDAAFRDDLFSMVLSSYTDYYEGRGIRVCYWFD